MTGPRDSPASGGAPRGGLPGVTVVTEGVPAVVDDRPARSRHGREFRSSATGPELAPLRSRGELFAQTLESCAEYLASLWPNELSQVVIEAAGAPEFVDAASRMPRWRLEPEKHRILIYRVPLERLPPGDEYDDQQYRMFLESVIFRAVAEYLGKDPWDVAPGRFRD